MIMTRTVAALFVDPRGCYAGLDGVEVWDEARDARLYPGPHPVVAHPPCNLWVNLAAVNWKRYKKRKPAWYAGGDDGGCFESALASVRKWGGVLEHPALTHAWAAHDLPRPLRYAWLRTMCGGWVCEVDQGTYGHRAKKSTWLYFFGAATPVLDWSVPEATHQVGWFDRNKPTVGKREAYSTPPAFRDILIEMARSVKQ